jgi:carboxypeptidase family protein
MRHIGLRRSATHALFFSLVFASGLVAFAPVVEAQALTGALIGSVKDAQGGVLPGAIARVTSPALIGGPAMVSTNEKGQLRFPALPPGRYALEIELKGFATYREDGILIGAGATIERTAVLRIAGVEESIVVQGAGSRIEARDPGFSTRFGPDDLKAIPTRRVSMFDFIRAVPGISPTSPSSSASSPTVTTISAFGSGTNENQFLIDGTNFTCPCNGVARSEPGSDFIQEIQVQSVGASAEYGNVQGAVVNVITRQGSEAFLGDTSYYAQPSALTSQPVTRPFAGGTSGFERIRYRDFTANLGGPAIHNRLWFFGGYQYLRDYDSQPAADPKFPRIYDQNKGFGKLTWNLAPAWRLVQSVHYEHWISSDPPTSATPFEALFRRTTSVPAITFGELTHTVSPSTLWDVRAGRFVFAQDNVPTSGNWSTPSRLDNATGVTTGAPSLIGSPTIARTTIKATLNHYSAGWFGADHQWKVGTQFERAGHHAGNIVRREVCGQRRQPVAEDLGRSVQRGRPLCDGRGLCQRRGDAGRPRDGERRPALRSHPGNQPGSSGARSARP